MMIGVGYTIFVSSYPHFPYCWCSTYDPTSRDVIAYFWPSYPFTGLNSQPHPSKYLPKHVFLSCSPSKNMGGGPYLPPKSAPNHMGWGGVIINAHLSIGGCVEAQKGKMTNRRIIAQQHPGDMQRRRRKEAKTLGEAPLNKMFLLLL